MKRLLMVAMALCFIVPIGPSASATLTGVGPEGSALVSRLQKLVPAPFLRTNLVATVQADDPFVFLVKFGTDGVLGFYTGAHDIHIRADLKLQDRDMVVTHEYGHFVYYNLLTFRERQSWEALWATEKFRDDEYRSSSASEGFAEAFAFRVTHDYVDRKDIEDDFLSKIEHRLADALTD